MYIFGGYVRGGKSNDLWKYDLENNDWVLLNEGDYKNTDPKYHQDRPKNIPAPRIGAAILEFKQAIYLFGGHDEQNEKLDDFWKFDLASKQWILIESTGSKPTGRNGHSMVLINNKLVMFGGILEITKETDDVFIYDFASNKWIIYESPHHYGNNSPMNIRDTDS
jgi:Galactose oxidase, central domain